MVIISTSTQEKRKVLIEPVENDDFKTLSKKRYFFDWKTERSYEVYKLSLANTNEILGLASIERIPDEWRIHIRLLTVSRENKGRNKEYENITGNLITYISKIALREYGELACVSLKPKEVIAKHYMEKYGMNVTGLTLSVEIKEIMKLINDYDHD